jgi:hypothetical protein
MFRNSSLLCSHEHTFGLYSGPYESMKFTVLWCDTLQSGRCLPMLRRNLLIPYSEEPALFWRERQQVAPKRRQASIRLHDATSQKTANFIDTTASKYNLTHKSRPYSHTLCLQHPCVIPHQRLDFSRYLLPSSFPTKLLYKLLCIYHLFRCVLHHSNQL